MTKSTEKDDAWRRQIDRLVSGDLTADGRRSLVLRLDSEPGLWRQCGLAFLEWQAWQSGLQSWTHDSPRPIAVREHAKRTSAPRSSAPSHSSSAKRREARWVIAAALLLTFAAGMLVGLAGRNGPPAEQRIGQMDSADADRNSGHAPTIGAQAAVGHSSIPSGQSQPSVAMFNVFDGDNRSTPVVQVPIVWGPGYDAQWAANRPAALSNYQLAQLERRGYKMVHQRQMVPLNLADGRRVILPVDRYQAKYIGLPAY